MTSESADAVHRLLHLIDIELKGEIPIDQFVNDYERIFNLELDQTRTPPEILSPLRELFDVVVFFSPYEQDIDAYPGYKSEAQVREATKAAAAKLSDHQ